jgi:hypothetical protein
MAKTVAKPRRRPIPRAFVLRSGYTIPFDGADPRAIMDHLKKAIIGESMERASRKKHANADALAQEILAEASHLAESIPPDFALALLADLLADTVFDRLRIMVEKHNADLPTNLIQ